MDYSAQISQRKKPRLNSMVALITRSSLIGELDVDLKEYVEHEAEYCVKVLSTDYFTTVQNSNTFVFIVVVFLGFPSKM
ncbi:hypothetical protein TNIN_194241 [Trichonephila inaurata madagascariensis]|uniref:Uncharacterized protein n=1 Tax=Trichonephila inaurata madagascariensis TaxID=2747483 RepID=A0A8X6YDF0_9ARAC|nr:hypothetical protein TNIN_194241 [Trichonephila inaurata madagascariensis]